MTLCDICLDRRKGLAGLGLPRAVVALGGFDNTHELELCSTCAEHLRQLDLADLADRYTAARPLRDGIERRAAGGVPQEPEPEPELEALLACSACGSTELQVDQISAGFGHVESYFPGRVTCLRCERDGPPVKDIRKDTR